MCRYIDKLFQLKLEQSLVFESKEIADYLEARTAQTQVCVDAMMASLQELVNYQEQYSSGPFSVATTQLGSYANEVTS